MPKNLAKNQKRSRFFYSGSGDPIITIVVVLLMILGSFMIVSTDVGQTTVNPTVVLSTSIKQIIYLAAAVGGMWAAFHFFSFQLFRPFQFIAISGMTGLLFATQLFAESGGSKAWIRIGGFSVQPAEFVKPLMIILIAYAIYIAKERPRRRQSFQILYRTPLVSYAIFMFAIFLQKDIGTLTIITMICFICVLIPDYPTIRDVKTKLKRLFFVGMAIILAFFVFTDIGIDIIAKTPMAHIATRFKNAKDPYEDVYGEGYQPANALYGIANSNIVGRGIGGSARKYGYLTQADNDYIFAVLIEETGIFGLLALMFLYGVLFLRLAYYAFKTKNIPYKVILVGNATYLFMHFFLNVGGVTCLIPMTGVPLLFISSGGSALISICATFGLSQRCISEIRLREMSVRRLKEG